MAQQPSIMRSLLCRVLQVGVAAAGSVRILDESARMTVEQGAQHDANFVMLIPYGCRGEVCAKMENFWASLAEAAPLDVLWRVHCDDAPASHLLCARMPHASDEPLVLSWSGQEWQSYSGPRNPEALGKHVAEKVNAAQSQKLTKDTSKDTAEYRVVPQGHEGPADTCLQQAFQAYSQADQTVKADNGRLRPENLPSMPIFKDFVGNTSVEHPTLSTQIVAKGEVRWPSALGNFVSNFDVLPGLMVPEEVRRVLELMNVSSGEADGVLEFDTDPDSVDGMVSHEMFVYTATKFKDVEPVETKGGDSNPAQREARVPVRAALEEILAPIIESRITPFVRRRFPDACGRNPLRLCTPCSSLIRRYRPGERRSHDTHYDGEALVTVVVSLSQFGEDYTGGLYLAAGSKSRREVLPLLRGDAVVHQSDLLHGVEVEGGERWSWIMWYRDSPMCEEHGHEWFATCAQDGNPICQGLHATKVGMLPGLPRQEHARQMLEWNMKAAEGGLPQSILKIGRAYLKRLPSDLPFKPEAAARLYRKGIKLWEDPECYYGLAQMVLENQTQWGGNTSPREEALQLFEEAAQQGHRFAAYNLGLAHLYGLGTLPDGDLAASWFGHSGLPEGLHAVALYHETLGRMGEAMSWRARAKAIGYGASWRERARTMLGSGGAGGVSMYSAWHLDAVCQFKFARMYMVTGATDREDFQRETADRISAVVADGGGAAML